MSQTLAELQADLVKYVAARDSILDAGQTTDIDGLRVEKARLDILEKKIKELRQEITLAGSSGRLRHSVAVFGGHR
jgi:hypothetical protein